MACLNVRTDNIRDVLAAYRRVLIDAPPTEALQTREDLIVYYHKMRSILEDRLMLGVKLGVENGHTLLLELAKLALEGAANRFDSSSERPEIDERQLEAALRYVEAAEQIFVGDGNHRIGDVYMMKAKVLMAMRRYREAQEIMRAVPDAQARSDPSFPMMVGYASSALGNPQDSDSIVLPDMNFSDIGFESVEGQ